MDGGGRRVQRLGLMALWVWWFNGGFIGLPGVTPAMSAVFLLGPFVGLLGPVIGFEAVPLGYCLATGLPLLAAIASHPAYPQCPSVKDHKRRFFAASPYSVVTEDAPGTLTEGHCAYPRWWTGVLCFVGVLVWFVLSMSFIHQASA